VKSARLSRVGEKIDISYGIYLYAWPVQKVVIWLMPGVSPWQVFVEATAVAGVLALASWWLVERPFLMLKKPAYSLPRLFMQRRQWRTANR
jgi:peptidoglycan/LPS O-acetylase OafA/YrhL